MGQYTSAFVPLDDEYVADDTNPRQEDWITAHADATGLAMVEVERLWIRFQQMGATENGVLTEETLNSPRLNKDAFVRNIMRSLKDNNGIISFEVFLNAMSWCEGAELETKLRATFHLLNAGRPVNREILTSILKNIYDQDSLTAVQKVVDAFMEQMDPRKIGEVDEESFITYLRTLPARKIEDILAFNIVPVHINEDAHRSFTANSQAPVHGRQVPPEALLLKIAEKAQRRDWHLLANELGFTSNDIADFEGQHPNAVDKQIFSMLKAWKSREGDAAYAETLENALRDSNMAAISLMLAP